MGKFIAGDMVTAKTDGEPYYSGYGINPRVVIPAGSVGTVKCTDVPFVSRQKGEPAVFNCVDFVIPGVYAGAAQHGNKTWRRAICDSDLALWRRFGGASAKARVSASGVLEQTPVGEYEIVTAPRPAEDCGHPASVSRNG